MVVELIVADSYFRTTIGITPSLRYFYRIISVIHKFITISNECEKLYLKECASAGIEADKLR